MTTPSGPYSGSFHNHTGMPGYCVGYSGFVSSSNCAPIAVKPQNYEAEAPFTDTISSTKFKRTSTDGNPVHDYCGDTKMTTFTRYASTFKNEYEVNLPQRYTPSDCMKGQTIKSERRKPTMNTTSDLGSTAASSKSGRDSVTRLSVMAESYYRPDFPPMYIKPQDALNASQNLSSPSPNDVMYRSTYNSTIGSSATIRYPPSAYDHTSMPAPCNTNGSVFPNNLNAPSLHKNAPM